MPGQRETIAPADIVAKGQEDGIVLKPDNEHCCFKEVLRENFTHQNKEMKRGYLQMRSGVGLLSNQLHKRSKK